MLFYLFDVLQSVLLNTLEVLYLSSVLIKTGLELGVAGFWTCSPMSFTVKSCRDKL